MATEVIMPALEMSQESGVLVQWLKSEGEFVGQGEPLMEIETDKAVMEIEASAAGILSSVTARPGDEVPVGQVIAWLLEEGEQPPAEQSESASGEPPRADTPAIEAPGKKAAPAGPSRPARGRVRASPKTRRMARELGIDLSTVVGSGPGGAILPDDLSSATADSPAPEAPDQGEYRVVPLKGTRRTVAERTRDSYRDAPHISLSLAIDVSASQNETTGQTKLTPLLLKRVAACLLRHSRVNAHLVGAEIREFRSVHLGVAVALDEGLVVPVIRNVQQKGVPEIQSELEELAARAREKRLQPQEMQGGTFTVSNLGMYGISQFTSILNPPEVGILSVGTVRESPVAVDGEVVLRPLMNVTLNADHRAVDGAVAAQFLQTLKELIEHPPASS